MMGLAPESRIPLDFPIRTFLISSHRLSPDGQSCFCTLIPVSSMYLDSGSKACPCVLIVAFAFLSHFPIPEFLPCPDPWKQCLLLMLGSILPLQLLLSLTLPPFISLYIGFFPQKLVPVTHTRTLLYRFHFKNTTCPTTAYPNHHPATVGGSVAFLLPSHFFPVC